MPLVSVIIPAYNRATLIPETLESVLQQSFRDFEIIVVDDGSLDNTAEVVSKFPVIYIKQVNQGAPIARNSGIKIARGKYIAVLDSDDCLCVGSLEKRVEALEKYPGAALVYGQAIIIESNGREIPYKYPLWPETGLRNGMLELRQLLYANHIPASSVMIRRNCLDQIGLYNPNFTRGQEDLELWVRLSSVFDLFYIAEPLIKLRIHSQRLTNRLNLSQEENNHKAIIDSVVRNPVIQPLFAREQSKIYAHLYYYMAEVACSQQAFKDIRNYVSKFIKLNPGAIFSRSGIKAIAMVIISLAPAIFHFRRILKKRLQGTSANQSRWQPMP